MRKFPRRNRTTFSKSQIDLLRRAFKHENYPDADVRQLLAQQTGLPQQRIQVWFQNQRAKERKRNGLQAADPSGLNYASPSYELNINRVATMDGQVHEDESMANHESETPRFNAFIEDHQQRQLSPPIKIEATPIRDDCMNSLNASALSFHAINESNLASDSLDSGRKQQPQAIVRIYSTQFLNEAAQAVREGKVASIIEYHQRIYGDDRSQQERQSSVSLIPNQLSHQLSEIKFNNPHQKQQQQQIQISASSNKATASSSTSSSSLSSPQSIAQLLDDYSMESRMRNCDTASLRQQQLVANATKPRFRFPVSPVPVCSTNASTIVSLNLNHHQDNFHNNRNNDHDHDHQHNHSSCFDCSQQLHQHQQQQPQPHLYNISTGG